MNLSISRSFYFDSAHSLPEHDGKCKHLHGHTYKLVVQVTNTNSTSDNLDNCKAGLFGNGPKKGMLGDFGDLKRIVKRIVIDEVDHKNLDDLFPYTTCELMVIEIWKRLESELSFAGFLLDRLELSEICLPTESKAILKR